MWYSKLSLSLWHFLRLLVIPHCNTAWQSTRNTTWSELSHYNMSSRQLWKQKNRSTIKHTAAFQWEIRVLFPWVRSGKQKVLKVLAVFLACKIFLNKTVADPFNFNETGAVNPKKMYIDHKICKDNLLNGSIISTCEFIAIIR